MIYVFDGTFDGFLTAVFDVAGSAEPLDGITDAWAQGSFFDVTQVAKDAFKAGRVRRFLETRCGDEMPEMVRYAFLSANPDRFTYTARTLCLARAHGAQVLDLVHDSVLGFRACYREAMHETHRFSGLTRFQEMEDGLLYAVIAPKHNVLPPLLAHFALRYPRERIAVYDEGRRLLGMLDAGAVTLLEADVAPPPTTQDEQACRALWRTFFDTLAIRERLNPNLQRQHMPKYTWRNLVEMQRDPAAAQPAHAFSLQDGSERGMIPL